MSEKKAWENIASQRLCLRRLQGDDAETLYLYRSSPKVNKYQCWRPESIEEVREFIEKQTELLLDTPNIWFQLAICDKHSGAMLGDCGFHFLNQNSCQSEIGFTIYTPYQGNGYAEEAVKAMINYLFFELAKHRVLASVDPCNIPSVRVLERVGLRKEAHFRKSFWFDNDWVDDVVYAILADEWVQ
jgi:RimJ/RimL family protein N-acetyltransferase